MRRRDIIVIGLMGGIALYSWHKMQPPTLETGDQPVDQEISHLFSTWHGPIAKAQAQSLDSQITDVDGQVKGASTDSLNVPQSPPATLLPVEQYIGSPTLRTWEEMLAADNVTVKPEDIVQAFPDPALGLGSQIKVYRATPLEVTDWGKKKTYRTWQGTVGDFLEEQGIDLGDNDRVEPDAKTALMIGEDGQAHILITRVAITELKTKEKIDFKKIEKEDPDLPRGQTKVTPGVLGERTKTFRVTRENGIETKRELINNEVTKEPKDQLTVIGTKVLIGDSYTGIASWYKYNSTKVASDKFKRGTLLRITNLDNGKQIFVKSDGCICDDSKYVVDLHPDYFQQLGGKISDGLMKHVRVDEILN